MTCIIMAIRQHLAIVSGLTALISCATPCFAQQAGLATPIMVRGDVESWLDGYMPLALASAAIPGAVVVVVKDRQLLLAKGYGFAELAQERPVDAALTLFRIGSISKLFTWTAVMQLVEQGRIDLDADVNRYLDFRIPPFAGGPVTMRQLMTHTAGFEEARRGVATLDPKRVVPLARTMRQDLPARVYAAGSVPAYSNYGAALAGYIVERASGQPFATYVDRRILAPLGMRRSSFLQPLPPALLPHVSSGYSGSNATPGRFELVNWAPAGGLSATGQDMARFMIVHLQNGAVGGTRILSAASVRTMQQTTPGTVPGLHRMTLGFFERDINGHDAIGHDGDTILFHSLLALFPADGVGLFVSFNGTGAKGGAGAMRQQLLEQFADRYLPARAVTTSLVSRLDATRHARMFAGSYVSSRSYSSSFMALTRGLFPVRVGSRPNGTIDLSGPRGPSGEPRRFREVTPFVWHQIGGHDRLSAAVKNGRIVRFSTDSVSPAMIFDAVPWWLAPSLLLPAFVIGVLVMVIWLLAWPVAMWRRRANQGASASRPARRGADLIARVSVGLVVLAVAGWGWLLTQLTSAVGVYQLADHANVILAIETVTILGFGGACAAMLFRMVIVWREGSTWRSRMAAVLLFSAAIAATNTAVTYRLMHLSTAF